MIENVELTYFVPIAKLVSSLKKAGLVHKNLSLDYSFYTVLVELPNSRLIYQPMRFIPVMIVIRGENFKEGVSEMGELLRSLKLPLYDDRESLVCPVNHLGMNPLGLPLNWHHNS
jgi:hypothetical protein